jgi:hypothetical protein
MSHCFANYEIYDEATSATLSHLYDPNVSEIKDGSPRPRVSTTISLSLVSHERFISSSLSIRSFSKALVGEHRTLSTS